MGIVTLGFEEMNVGYKLLLIGLVIVIVLFVLLYEYPNLFTGGIGGIIALGSLILVVIGGIITYKAESRRNICQNCGQQLDKQGKYCPKCGTRN